MGTKTTGDVRTCVVTDRDHTRNVNAEVSCRHVKYKRTCLEIVFNVLINWIDTFFFIVLLHLELEV